MIHDLSLCFLSLLPVACCYFKLLNARGRHLVSNSPIRRARHPKEEGLQAREEK